MMIEEDPPPFEAGHRLKSFCAPSRLDGMKLAF